MIKFERIEIKNWMRIIAVIAGLLIFFSQAFYFAHYFDVTMDEGTYPLKGLLFLRGDYRPFQDYGLWTNKMPLSFLIPGIAQYFFEPGLRTARYFSIFLSGLMLLGLWLFLKRNLNKDWAVFTFLIFLLNTGTVFYYFQAISQVVTALFATWSLYFLLGQGRKNWEILVGSILALLVVFTRQNMLPVLPFTILYVFWQHGKKSGLMALAVTSLIFLGLHIYYWPNIMVLWVYWFPKFIRNLIDLSQFSSGGAISYPNPQYGFFTRFFVFWDGFRTFFALFSGVILAVFCFPRKRNWGSQSNFKSAVFSGVSFLVLWAAHFWASLIRSECVYCYPGYLAFFLPYGIAFVIITLDSGQKSISKFGKWSGVIFFTISSAGLGFSAYKELNWVINMPFPRVKNLQIQSGSIEIWRLLSNKYGWQYDALERILPAVFGLVVGIGIVLILWLLAKNRVIKSASNYPLYWASALLIIFFGNIILSIPYPGGSKNELKCSGDIIASHEEVGKYIQSVVPPGSLVYWESDITPIPLASIPGVRVFPAQLNHFFSRVIGGDIDKVEKKGYWNDELAQKWSQEADYLLIADSLVELLTQQGILTPQMAEIGESPAVSTCRERSSIHIYLNK